MDLLKGFHHHPRILTNLNSPTNNNNNGNKNNTTNTANVNSSASNNNDVPTVVPENVFQLVGNMEKERREIDAKIVQETSRVRSLQAQLERTEKENIDLKQRESELIEQCSRNNVDSEKDQKVILQLKESLKSVKQEVQLLNEHLAKEKKKYDEARDKFISKIDQVNTELRNVREFCKNREASTFIPKNQQSHTEVDAEKEALKFENSQLSKKIQELETELSFASENTKEVPTEAPTSENMTSEQEEKTDFSFLQEENETLKASLEKMELYSEELQTSLKEFETYSSELEVLIAAPCESCGAVRNNGNPENATMDDGTEVVDNACIMEQESTQDMDANAA